jgi:hypothetical protein
MALARYVPAGLITRPIEEAIDVLLEDRSWHKEKASIYETGMPHLRRWYFCPAGDVEAIQKRVQELEAQLRAKETQHRDAILEAKKEVRRLQRCAVLVSLGSGQGISLPDDMTGLIKRFLGWQRGRQANPRRSHLNLIDQSLCFHLLLLAIFKIQSTPRRVYLFRSC